MNKKRLLKLADFLESLPKRRFDLSLIALSNKNGDKPAPATCGTAACAIGWMPHVFPRICKYRVHVNDRDLSVIGKENYAGSSDFKLAEKILDLAFEECQYLFTPWYYGARQGVKTVVNRIRQFVKDGVCRT